MGTFSFGNFLYNATTHLADQTLEISCDASMGKPIYLPEKSETAFRLDIKGLTKAALMGNLSPLPAFGVYQLPLPFDYPDTTL